MNDFNQVISDGALTFTYDVSGNRTQASTGIWITGYTYDDENRLTVITNGPAPGGGGGGQQASSSSGGGGGNPPPATGGWKAEFTYDGLGRLRVRKDYYTYTGGYYLTNTTRYVYDGKRVIQERDSFNNPTVTYTRGLDLSSSLEGAGGIGGLLARSHGYSNGDWTTNNFYHADAVGNVTYMISAAQAMVASYKYDPYGRLITYSGSLAAANVYRFSSKEFHGNSGLYYYLYRFYDPNTQRWMNRDPIEESGGLNLYLHVRNEPIQHIDPFGLDAADVNPLSEIPTSGPVVPPPTNIVPSGFVGWPPGSGIWSGNGPPGAPTTGFTPCKAEQEGQKKDIKYYDGPKCPDGSLQKCMKYSKCEKTGTAGPSGTIPSFGWKPYSRCAPCKSCKK